MDLTLLLYGIAAFVAVWTAGCTAATVVAIRSTEGLPPTFPGSPPNPAATTARETNVLTTEIGCSS